MKTATSSQALRVGLVIPHIFMQRDLLPYVIFSPAQLALSLAAGLQQFGAEITLYSPGTVDTTVKNVTTDLSLFQAELQARGDNYLDLLKKHPLTFVTLARQVQTELIAQAYADANSGKLDVVHIYTNEEELALPMAQLCQRPVVFTHHDPFNFLVKYKSLFPKYRHLNWLSLSDAQRAGMPTDTNWLATIYHGLSDDDLKPVTQPTDDYIAYLGRIIEPKGVHLAIAAVQAYNRQQPKQKLTLRIAGKHYAGHAKDGYWKTRIEPQIDGKTIIYDGFIADSAAKRKFLANARALLVPSLFAEPFGMVAIEALACGTPIIGLDSGALPEIIEETETGVLAHKMFGPDKILDEMATTRELAVALKKVSSINRAVCRVSYEQRFTAERMCRDHFAVYQQLADATTLVS